jgi:DNA repair photolyase
MENQNNITFVPSHYTQCIDMYEVDLTSTCSVNCSYCGLKNKSQCTGRNLGKFPDDIREKGIYLSPNSDPFSLFASDESHRLLEVLLPMGVPCLIITKSILPQRTIDLLAQYPSQVYVQISISRLNKDHTSIIEPGGASPRRRLGNVYLLTRKGIRVTPILMPLFPGIDDTDESLSSIVRACADAGAKYLKAAYGVIDVHNPTIVGKMNSDMFFKQSFAQMDEYLKLHIGGGLTVSASRRMKLYTTMTELCSSYGLQFQTCPILDPAVVNMDVRLCGTYKKKNEN